MTMKIEQRLVTALIPFANNARTHSDAQVAQIAASIREFGWTNPILVDGKNGVIAGHGRLLAARKLGMDTVPVIELAHLTETQKRAYIISDNKLALNAGWDDELLALELGELGELGFDLDLTGFTLDEIEALVPELIPEGLTDEDAVPEVPIVPVTKLGDVWLCGKHRVMCGDSTSIEAVEKLMDGVTVDMVLTDPPYGISIVSGGGKVGGGGASLIAIETQGKTGLIMELVEAYCDVIVKRWQDFTGNQSTLESDGRTFAEVSGDH